MKLGIHPYCEKENTVNAEYIKGKGNITILDLNFQPLIKIP